MRAIYISLSVFLATTAVRGEFEPKTQTQQALGGASQIGQSGLNGNNGRADQIADASRKDAFAQEAFRQKQSALARQDAELEKQQSDAIRKYGRVGTLMVEFIPKGYPDLAKKALDLGGATSAPAAGTAAAVSSVRTKINKIAFNYSGLEPSGRKFAELPADLEGGRVPKAVIAATDEKLNEFKGGLAGLANQNPFKFAARGAADPSNPAELEALCGEGVQIDKCFNSWLVELGDAGAKGFASNLSTPNPAKRGNGTGNTVPGEAVPAGVVPLPGTSSFRPSGRVPHFFPLFIWEAVEAIASSGNAVIDGFFGGRLRGTGGELLAIANDEEMRRSGIDPEQKVQAIRNRLDSDGHNANINFAAEFTNEKFKPAKYRSAAGILVEDVIPKSQAIVSEGIAAWTQLKASERDLAKKMDDIQRQRQALQDQLNEPPPQSSQNPLGNNSGQGGDSGQGGTSGGGGSGGGAGGGGGGGQGLQAAKGAEPVKLESMKLPGFPDGGGLSQGLNGLTSPSNGFPDRGALPSGNFQMPKLESTRGAPTRTQPFSYASGAKNAGAGPQPQGKTGSPIGGGGGGNDAAAAAGAGGGGNPPVAGGGAPGSGGGGNVPNVGEGGGGGEERGTTASFVRTTDYGGGGGEGGAGAGPDNGGNEGGGIGAKIAAATGGAGAVGFAAREIKANPRARGMGLMAYVGGFRDFCSEKRALGVGACGASSRNDSGRAFKSPGSDPIGNLVAQRVNASASAVGSARGFNTITK